MKATIRKYLAIVNAAISVWFGQQSIKAATRASKYTDSPTGVESLAVWLGYWTAWASLAEAHIAPIFALLKAAEMKEEKPKVVQHPGGVEELDWTDTKSSQDALKTAMPSPMPTKDTIH